MIKARLFRPFTHAPVERLAGQCPFASRCLDRTKEPGADGEPLYKDVLTALSQAGRIDDHSLIPAHHRRSVRPVIKEFTPAMVAGGVRRTGARDKPKNNFTIGIHDDVTHTSLDGTISRPTRCRHHPLVFYGLGLTAPSVSQQELDQDHRRQTPSRTRAGLLPVRLKKAGATTVSHLCASAMSRSARTYLIGQRRGPVRRLPSTRFLTATTCWTRPHRAAPSCSTVRSRRTRYGQPARARDATEASANSCALHRGSTPTASRQQTGRAWRINTIMQDLLLRHHQDHAIPTRRRPDRADGRQDLWFKGGRMPNATYAAIDAALAGLHQVDLPDQPTSTTEMPPVSRPTRRRSCRT